jgi:hypothetical protein
VPLRRALEVQRAGDREELAAVIEGVLTRTVEEQAGLAVTREGVVLVGVPEGAGDLDVLERASITGVVVVVLLEAEVPCRAGVAAGDDVPSGAALADQVERPEAAGDVEGARRMRCSVCR